MNLIAFTSIIAACALTVSAAPTLVYSPDKRFAVAWDDGDMGAPIGEIRSILLTEIPYGDRPFSLVTFPRYTRAFWSPDSKKCFIMNAPDDGNVQTWLFVAKDSGPQPDAFEIDPFKSLEKHFEDQDEKARLYRPGITDATWADNRTLKLDALDNNGKYNITLRIDSPNQPVIQKLTIIK